MQPRSQRRVHSAEFKAQVLAECQQPEASVAAVALGHGLNVNLVRKWLVGRGLKRAGLSAPRTMSRHSQPGEVAVASAAPAALQFLPMELAAAAVGIGNAGGAALEPSPTERAIHVELRRGAAQLSVHWPVAQAGACAAWLQAVACAALK